MPLKLNSTSGGSVTLQEPTTASNRTLTLPDATGTVNTSGAVNEVPAGSASAPSIYPTGDTNTGIFFPAADTIAFAEGGAEAVRIDSSRNLLVGTTTSVLTTARATFSTGSSAGIVSAVNSNINLFCVNTNNTSWDAVSFRYNTSTEVGRVACTSTATSYVTSSDHRLKKDIQPMTGALEKVAALKPVTYKWKVDGSDGQGFIAHELQAVVPDAVVGEKDALDAEGKPVYQGIDTSFLVATLTAAIQEQQAMIEELKAKVAALEAK
jgi:hypothetical protein